MKDRELLELAAKACGYDTSHRWNAERLLLDPPVIDLCIQNVSTGWNPLDDDGDALRLAVAIAFADGVGLAMFFADADDPTVVVRKNDNQAGSMELVGDDPCAATRRAIVRAAAEIGKAMK